MQLPQNSALIDREFTGVFQGHDRRLAAIDRVEDLPALKPIREAHGRAFSHRHRGVGCEAVDSPSGVAVHRDILALRFHPRPSWPGLHRSESHPVVDRVGSECPTVRDFTVLGVVIPTPASEYTMHTNGRPAGIGLGFGGVVSEPIPAPFEVVARHVIQAKAIGRVRTHLHRTALLRLVVIGAIGGDLL